MAASTKKYFRKFCFFSLCLLSFITFVCIVRTLSLSEHTDHETVETKSYELAIKADEKRLKRFQEALRFKTISFSSEKNSPDELIAYTQFIKKSYPNIHNNPGVQHEVVNNYSLLYKVQGTDTSLKPYLLCAHLDVVPIDGQEWNQPAFEGKIVDGYIYGRGALDDKHGLMGILEALEYLLEKGHKFKRTFYVAFGHDEEVTGFGAEAIAKLFKSRGLEFEFVYDEGLTVIENAMVEGPMAVIGVSEKGFLTLELSVEYTGGHSSMPDSEGAISILARAVSKLKDNPQPSMLGYGPEIGTLLSTAPKMSFLNRLAIANVWLFKPIMSWMLSRKPASNALIRTTTAVTMFHSGVKSNILPQSAKAIVNHRVHPAQTLKEVIEYDRQVINDVRVNITMQDGDDPHPMSPYDETTFGYQIIKKSISTIFQEAVVAPGIMIANTDTKHYLQFSKCIYRFRPAHLYLEDLNRIHGKNERISVKNYEQVLNFFMVLMLNGDSSTLRPPHEHGEL
ncbi:N-fatty-acyl-amino acid synthase/hydrolase PM20D1.2-like [Lineus longissimus]|uniref:N-fatty-acyl-amino acid synthase/hydrolase PM20D1.2-like n=1 Tax=Lineus longissimus TaxID=88925 RepID=UPI002B4D5309